MSFAEKYSPKGSGGNFVSTIIKGKALVCELRFPYGERIAWFILHIDDAKYSGFKQAMSLATAIELTDYGTILHSGWGKPSGKIKAEMNDKYGMYE